MGKGRNWSEEEKEYLAEFWGVKSINAICEHLGRSKNAINVMKNRLNLGPFLEAGDYITCHQLYIALGLGRAADSYKMKSWVENRGFPVKYKILSEKKVKVIYLDDFWKWAEENQAFLDFSNFEENALGLEPAWVKGKRRRDARAPRQTPWTAEEDFRLKQLVERKEHGLKEVTEKAYLMRRTFVSEFSAGKKYEAVLNLWMREYIERELTGKATYSTGVELLCEKVGEEYSKYKDSVEYEKLKDYESREPGNALIVMLHAVSGDSSSAGYYYSGWG